MKMIIYWAMTKMVKQKNH